MNIYILIDRSGSMLVRWSETITAVNAYAKQLKDNLKDKGRITVACFDAFAVAEREFETVGSTTFEILRKRKIKEWQDIDGTEVAPRGMTPLYDAIGTLNSFVEADDPKKAAVAIITDGEENASTALTRQDTKGIIERWGKEGYDVVFLGADFDAFGQASSIGVGAGQTMTMTAGHYGEGAKSLAARTTAYAASGVRSEWTDEDRARATGRLKE